MDNPEKPVLPSPKWSPLTKLAVGMTFIAILAAMLVRFRTIVGPLIMASVLSYLLFPVASRFRTTSKLSWRASVNLIYLVVAVIFGGLLAVAGITIVQQVISLINFVGQLTADLPAIVADLSTHVYVIGPFQFSLQQYDLQALVNQVISVVQPILGRLGGLVSTLATSAITTLSWAIFVLVISYFLLADAGRMSNQLVNMQIPGYSGDLQRLGLELQENLERLLARPAHSCLAGNGHIHLPAHRTWSALRIRHRHTGRPGAFCAVYRPVHCLGNVGSSSLLSRG